MPPNWRPCSPSLRCPDMTKCDRAPADDEAGSMLGALDPTVDPILAAFVRSWRDRLQDSERELLKPLIAALPGTNCGPGAHAQRAMMVLDWEWRVHAPYWLGQVPELAEHGEKLRALGAFTGWRDDAERTVAFETANEAAKTAHNVFFAWQHAGWNALAANAAVSIWHTCGIDASWDAWTAWNILAGWSPSYLPDDSEAVAARENWDVWATKDRQAAEAAKEVCRVWARSYISIPASHAAMTATYNAAKDSSTKAEAHLKVMAYFEPRNQTIKAQLPVFLQRLMTRADRVSRLLRIMAGGTQ